MTSENEHRVFGHLLRVVSALRLIELDHQHGHTAVALESQLKATRRYLMENCPRLLLFVELCYDKAPIPDGLSMVAEQEAVCGTRFQS